MQSPLFDFSLLCVAWEASYQSTHDMNDMYLNQKNDIEMDSSEEEEEEENVEIWIEHYSSRQRILLIGEGDFSFSVCLATRFGSACNMVSTTIDSQEELAKKYSNAIKNVRELEEKGCLVLYGIDAKNMSQHFFLRTQRFDRIVYNFPHVGFHFREDSLCQIQLNKELVEGFLREAKVMLKKVGEIHVANKEGKPYNEWGLEAKAAEIGLVIHEITPFYRDGFPGYQNKRAHGNLPDDAFTLGKCSTYKFKLQPLPLSSSDGGRFP